jgi:hypothetical protein
MDGRVQKVMLLMLSSNEPGEIVSARDTLIKLLRDSKIDIYDFVGLTNGLSKAEMKKLCDTGYAGGVLATENKQFNGTDFANIGGLPNWEEIARYCQIIIPD